MNETKGTTPSPQELEAEFDPRLADVWLAAFSSGLDIAEVGDRVGVLLRMAYLKGYQDSLTEDVRGEMFTKLGIPVPKPAVKRPVRRRR